MQPGVPNNDNATTTTLSDLRVVLVYGQWMWPLVLFSGMTPIYMAEDQWALSMIGNAMMLSTLWWITSAPSNTSGGGGDGTTITTASVAATTQKNTTKLKPLGRMDILPTVIWGLLPPMSSYLSYHPEACAVLLLGIVLPFVILCAMRIKRYGFPQTLQGITNRAKTNVIHPIAKCSESIYSFKSMEEQYFERLREFEDEEQELVKKQQERLAYLEDTNRLKKRNQTGKPKLVILALVLCGMFSLVYHIVVIIPAGMMHDPASVVPTQKVTMRWEQVGVVVGIRSQEQLENLISNSNLSKHVFIHYQVSWSEHCQQVLPIWQSLALHVASDSIASEMVIAQVDCVRHSELCRSQSIRTFPTLRWYYAANGPEESFEINRYTDYKSTRDVSSLMTYSKDQIEEFNNKKQVLRPELFEGDDNDAKDVPDLHDTRVVIEEEKEQQQQQQQQQEEEKADKKVGLQLINALADKDMVDEDTDLGVE